MSKAPALPGVVLFKVGTFDDPSLPPITPATVVATPATNNVAAPTTAARQRGMGGLEDYTRRAGKNIMEHPVSCPRRTLATRFWRGIVDDFRTAVVAATLRAQKVE